MGQTVPITGKREPNPLAPSLPLLSEAEEARYDKIVNQFIKYDLGQLPGAEGLKAKNDFLKLTSESIPALFRGLQISSKLEHSCPVAMISQKLKSFLLKSEDDELLDYARDELTSALEGSRHAPLLQDMRLGVTLRRKVVLANKPAVPKWLLSMTVAEMLKSLQEEENQQKHKLMAQELGRRGDHESLQGLGLFAVSFYPEVKEPSIKLLQEKMRKLKIGEMQEFLKDTNPLLRQKAAEAMGNLKATKGAEDLVPLLLDANGGVQKAAREALVKIGAGKDFGPIDFSNSESVKKSQLEWKRWLTEQGMK
ncbi:MAG: hypothetical protein RIR22_172 [Planctomycetota bacterium]